MEARPYRYDGGRAGARPSRAVAKRGRPGAGLAALVLFVAFVSLVAWWLWPKGGAEPPPEAPRRSAPKAVKEVKPAKAPKASERRHVRREERKPPIKGETYEERPSVLDGSSSTNGVTYIVPPIAPDDPDVALRSRTSQEIGSLLSITPGEPVPPFPYSFILEDDAKKQGETASNGNDLFLESLRKAKIQAKDTDSEAVAKHKEAIVAAQMDLLDGIKDGLSVNDTIRAAYEFRVRAYEYRTGLISTLREWAEDGPTREDFAKALADINGKLKDEGILAIPAEEVMPELKEDEE